MSSPADQRSNRRRNVSWWCGFGLMASLLVGAMLLLPALQPARESGPHPPSCVNRLKVIALALQDYHNQHKCFPPAYVADQNGQPMHSWRVLLLPYVVEQGLYARYDLGQPWDSPHNLALAQRRPEIYHCPQDSGAGDTGTSYVMLVGRGASSDGPHSRAIKEITDGTSNTIMIAERSESGIHWMEPRDLNVDEMEYKINDPTGKGVRSPHPGVANAIFADGTVNSISEDIDPEILKALITIDAGDRGSEFHSRYSH